MRVEEVQWDDWNINHIARHAVTVDEVEDVLLSPPLRARRVGGGKLLVYGQTAAGRYLTVAVAPRSTRAVYVVTARDMSPAERRHFSR